MNITSIAKEQVEKVVEWLLDVVERLLDFDWKEEILMIVTVGFCVLMVIAVGIFIADILVTEPYIIQGKIIEAEYTPASTGVGTGIGSDGKPVTVVTSKSEKWTLIVSVKGEIKSFDVSPDMYYSIKIGENIKMECRRGKIVGVMVSCTEAKPHKE